MSYTIKKAPNGTNVLQINGRDCICPFRTPVMMEIATGQNIKSLSGGAPQETRTAKMSEICSDSCPLFSLFAGNHSVSLHCGTGRDILLQKPGSLKIEA